MASLRYLAALGLVIGFGACGDGGVDPVVPAGATVSVQAGDGQTVVVVAGATEPPPDTTVQLTTTPARPLPKLSTTVTVSGWGSGALTTPTCRSPEVLTSRFAAPGITVRVKVSGELTAPGTVAVITFGPDVVPAT